MPYLQVEIDALKQVHAAAPLVGVPAQQLLGGLVELWAWCWSNAVDQVTDVQMEGIVGVSSPRLGEALQAFGFLERKRGGWRVRGASHYLRIRAAQKSAAEATNASKNASRSSARSTVRSTARSSARSTVRSRGALITDPPIHRSTERSTTPVAPSPPGQTEGASRPPAGAPPASEVLEVYLHWRDVQGGGGPEIPDPKQAARINARLRDGWTTAELKRVVDGAAAEARARRPGQAFDRANHFSIRTLFRDSDQVRKFVNWTPTPAPAASQSHP